MNYIKTIFFTAVLGLSFGLSEAGVLRSGTAYGSDARYYRPKNADKYALVCVPVEAAEALGGPDIDVERPSRYQQVALVGNLTVLLLGTLGKMLKDNVKSALESIKASCLNVLNRGL